MVSLTIDGADAAENFRSAAFGIVKRNNSDGTYHGICVFHRYCIDCGKYRENFWKLQPEANNLRCSDCFPKWVNSYAFSGGTALGKTLEWKHNKQMYLDDRMVTGQVIDDINNSAKQGKPYNLSSVTEIYISFHEDVTKLLVDELTKRRDGSVILVIPQYDLTF